LSEVEGRWRERLHMQLHFWVYLLRCADGSFYAGHTEDLEKRLQQHQDGSLPGYTSKRRPVTLVWADHSNCREDALAFERRIKGWSRAKKKALIAGDWTTIKWLSKPPRGRASTSLSTNEHPGRDSAQARSEPRPRASDGLMPPC
jgi:putative endonuclease